MAKKNTTKKNAVKKVSTSDQSNLMNDAPETAQMILDAFTQPHTLSQDDINNIAAGEVLTILPTPIIVESINVEPDAPEEPILPLEDALALLKQDQEELQLESTPLTRLRDIILSYRHKSKLTPDEAKIMFLAYNAVTKSNEHNYNCDVCAMRIYKASKNILFKNNLIK